MRVRLTCALGPDNSGPLLAGLIASAAKRLDIAVYECGPYFAPMLAAAARRGVALELLLDGHAGANRTTALILAHHPEACRLVRHAGMAGEGHWKLLAADEGVLAVGSGNLIKRDAPFGPAGAAVGTREWWLLLDGAAALARQTRAAIAPVWAAATPAGEVWPRWAALALAPVVPPVHRPDVVVPPLQLSVATGRLHLVTGGTAVAAALRRRLRDAARRLLVTVPYVHPVASVSPLIDDLAAATRRGLDVRLLLGDRLAAGGVATAGLLARELSVRVMDETRSTVGHAKGLVADDAVVAGSANWSSAGLGANHEAALVVDDGDAAAYYAAAFDRDWATALPPPA